LAQISSLFVRKVIAAASDSLNKPSLLREMGVDPDAALDFDMLVSEERYYDLLQRLAETEAGPVEFHLRAGASMRCDEYGVLGLAWKSAPTLLESFRRAVRYAELINGTRLYSVHEQEDTVLIAMDREARSPGVRLSNEAAMASFLALSQDSVGRAFAPLAVHYRHGPPPGSASHYQQHFGCPVHFSSQFNALAVPKAVALEPNRLGDTAMSRFFEAQLDHKLATLQRDISFEQRVQSQISAALPTGVPKKAEIARKLGLSDRTLNRRLADEGLSFQGLLEKSRSALASGLLEQSHYSLAEIAFLTGFSEQSAFTRAFKRWNGLTPQAYRQNE
jgi:AraC-like DNA-binding protein